MNKALVFLKKKKTKFLYLEDLYINKSITKKNQLVVSSEKGLNFLNIAFPRIQILNGYLFYAPIHKKLSVSISIIVKQLKLFLKGMVQGFFLEYRMVGLGFKVKRSGNFLLRTVKFDIGFSHFIKVPLSSLVRLCRIKKRFLFFSIDYSTIKIILKQIQNIRRHNPYKLRGLRLTGAKYRIKPGKKQTKR
jgi:ribosomal protein L6P/L9E